MVIDQLRQKLPQGREGYILFSSCLIPVHFWAILDLLFNLRPLLIRASFIEIVGVFGYVLGIAFIDSTILFIALFLLCLFLPSKLFKDRLIANGLILGFILVLWAITLQPQWIWIQNFHILLLFSIILVSYLMINLVHGLDLRVASLATRFSVLGTFYLMLDLLGIAVVVLRNFIR